jgi:NAD(P)-dependent dehydrogenase (short-subunit alcohol dehydrogenase family)
MMDTSKDENPGWNLGGAAYAMAKRQLSAYIHLLALRMGPRRIRANAVHPPNCNTDIVHDETVYMLFRPDLSNPDRGDIEPAVAQLHAMTSLMPCCTLPPMNRGTSPACNCGSMRVTT